MTIEADAARVEGATAERQRIRAIFELAETKGREEFAIAMALNSILSVDEVQAFLRGLPAEASTGRDTRACGRACESPIGLAIMAKPAAATYTAEELAAQVNSGAVR